MNENIYDIDFKNLVNWLVPEVLHKPRLMALVSALVTPVVFLHNQFKTNRDNNLYKLLITPQVCYMEMALNDKYDKDDRRIKIVRPKTYEAMFVFQKIENKPAYLYRKSETTAPHSWLYKKGEASDNQYDFIVKVPSTITFDMDEIMAVVDGYMLPDKFYTINIF